PRQRPPVGPPARPGRRHPRLYARQRGDAPCRSDWYAAMNVGEYQVAEWLLAPPLPRECNRCAAVGRDRSATESGGGFMKPRTGAAVPMLILWIGFATVGCSRPWGGGGGGTFNTPERGPFSVEHLSRDGKLCFVLAAAGGRGGNSGTGPTMARGQLSM